MTYSRFFGLQRQPFSNAPDPRFYFNSDQHGQALLRLTYAVDSNKGLAVLVGGVGTGKTTLARRMLNSLPEDKYESSLLVVVHSDITPEWIMARIALQLGVKEPATDRAALLKQLYDRLIEIERSGRKAVVLIDEAQMLRSQNMMEEFRGLLNLEIPGKKLLNIVFFGLPQLEEIIKLDEPLAQRVAVKFHLHSLTQKTTESYIHHRLQVAGGKKDMFEEEAIAGVYRFAGGVPRLINTLCDNSLFETYLQGEKTVRYPTVEKAALDLGLNDRPIDQSLQPADSSDLTAIDQMLEDLESR